ncbi:MAG: hypothetical protein ACM359_19480 [Bacillota bacterium]
MWSHAKARCYNPGDTKYRQYGGRGIKMCERWRDDFSAFYLDMGPCPPGWTIDRTNVDGDYEPGNCAWADSRQQARHRTDNVHIEFEGRDWVMKDLAAYLGVPYKLFHYWYRYKEMSVDGIIERAQRLGKREVSTSD